MANINANIPAAAGAAAVAAPVILPPLPDPISEVEQALIWIGFTLPAKRALVLSEVGTDLTQFLGYTHRMMENLHKTLGSRTRENERVRFGLARAASMSHLIDWVEDCDRLNMTPTLNGLNEDTFLALLKESGERARIRDIEDSGRSTRAKEAYPDKLKEEKDWNSFERKLNTVFSILLGVNGVPLLYVIREKEHTEGDVYESFTAETIAKARLRGPSFVADSRAVHQLLTALTVGENAEQWIIANVSKENGRLDMSQLRSHFRGVGNQTRRVAQAVAMNAKLHYKSERAMPFVKFISQVKEMYNIYEEIKEPKTEAEKLRFLLNRCDTPELHTNIVAMNVAMNANPDMYTFVSASDHIAAQVSTLSAAGPGRQLSSIHQDGGGSQSDRIMKDGKIHVGPYANDDWYKLSVDEKKQVYNERKKQGVKSRGKKGKGGGKGSNSKKNSNREVKALKKKLKESNKTVAALSRKHAENSSVSGSDSSGDEDASSAGDAFGGRAAKKSKKQKKKQRKN